MKNKFTSFIITVTFLLIYTTSFSQDRTVDYEPKYITITTLHGADGVNFEVWKAHEKEYFDKVTSKIDVILKHEVLISYFSKDLREIKVINVFKTWADIQYVNAVREGLIKKAWPNEEERKLFFEKQNGFYKNLHSDEIYLTSNLSKELSVQESKVYNKPMVFYVDTNILSDNENKDSYTNYQSYVNQIIFKNDFIKGYFPYRHFWGKDSREFVEMYVVKSLTELEKALKKNEELLKVFIPNKNNREKFIGTFGLAVTGHKDDIYLNVPSLSKR